MKWYHTIPMNVLRVGNGSIEEANLVSNSVITEVAAHGMLFEFTRINLVR